MKSYKQSLEEQYKLLFSLYGIGSRVWDDMYRSFSVYTFCDANKKCIISMYLELAFICALADCLGEQNVSVEDFLGMHTELIYNAVNTEYAVEFLNDYNAVKENGFMYECRHLCDGSPSRTRIEFDFQY